MHIFTRKYTDASNKSIDFEAIHSSMKTRLIALYKATELKRDTHVKLSFQGSEFDSGHQIRTHFSFLPLWYRWNCNYHLWLRVKSYGQPLCLCAWQSGRNGELHCVVSVVKHPGCGVLSSRAGVATVTGRGFSLRPVVLCMVLKTQARYENSYNWF